MIKTAVSGALGRMGRLISQLVLEDKDLELVLALEKKDHPLLGEDVGKILVGKEIGLRLESDPQKILTCDVLIDFSERKACLEKLEFCKKFKKKMVIGTTGFTDSEIEKIKEASKETAILLSPNMSFGVNFLFKLLRRVSSILKDVYDVEVIDIHHRFKKDAPSGTAKKFINILEENYKKPLRVHSLRIGEVVGDHYIIFCGNEERIEFVHRAISRKTFAKGAILACKFIANKEKGLYSMEDLYEF